MPVTDVLRCSAAPLPGGRVRDERDPNGSRPLLEPQPHQQPGPEPRRESVPEIPTYPQYWLVRSWNGAEPDEIGRSIMERAIYVSPIAGQEDHEAAVEIITDALCRWAHPDDIRWCHIPDAGTGGYTIVGTAIRSVSLGEGCALDEDDLI